MESRIPKGLEYGLEIFGEWLLMNYFLDATFTRSKVKPFTYFFHISLVTEKRVSFNLPNNLKELHIHLFRLLEAALISQSHGIRFPQREKLS